MIEVLMGRWVQDGSASRDAGRSLRAPTNRDPGTVRKLLALFR